MQREGATARAVGSFVLWAAVICGWGTGAVLPEARAGEPTIQAEVKSASVDGRLDGDRARLVIEANLGALGHGSNRVVYGVTVLQEVHASRERLLQVFNVRVDAVQGGLKEVVLALNGEGEVREVTGDGLEDWSVRWGAGGGRSLVLRLKGGDKPVTTANVQVKAEVQIRGLPAAVQALSMTTDPAVLANGYVRLDAEPELSVQAGGVTGLVPVEVKYLPEGLRPPEGKGASVVAYRFHGGGYSLPVRVRYVDPEAGRAALSGFQLTGRLKGDRASFTLTATARVRDAKGAPLELLRGVAALSELVSPEGVRLRFKDGRYLAEFDRAGEFPLRLQIEALVRFTNGWSEVDFGVAPSGFQPVRFEGMLPDTQFRFAGAARPERVGDVFTSHLPPSGDVKLAWKEGRPEAEGRLFYAAEAMSQVVVSPGLLRQVILIDFKVMQGELNQLSLRLEGEGEVTRVQGPAVLSWNLEPGSEAGVRRLVVKLNAAQKESFPLAVHCQRTLGAFPQEAEVLRCQPEGVTRYDGYVRLANEGAVRLEVLQATGLSQISPEQVPATETTKAVVPPGSTPRFAYRFSGPDHRLRLQADNILPELAVSQVLAYHVGETELAIDAEIELEVREAPLREAWVRIPRGFALARLTASGLSDSFTTETPGEPDALLRLVYGQPVLGRQVIQMRLERNQPLAENRWVLPRLEVTKAKSVRGHVAVAADAGFRLLPASAQGLTEIATAFLPKKLAGVQAAFRINEPGWQATIGVERLPQTIQADVVHLFSIGEGIAYGSSLVTYLIAGAPVSSLRIELSAEYSNPEFSGKNVRSYQKTDRGYLVQLHTPVAGTYTLLATYERPFKLQGENLTFTGARPADAQSEQGHTIVVSAYEFQVQPVDVSSSLTPVEPGEVPAEHRLLFDAPILVAYRYNSRPFNLELSLRPMKQMPTISQVVDRADLNTRVSEEGQVVTAARYFIKNKGSPHFRFVLPEGAELWSVTVNSNAVVPVQDQRANLVPLPQHADPSTLSEVQIKIAAPAKSASRLTVRAPIVSVPVLVAEWRVEPGPGRRLIYRGGTLTPSGGIADGSGFAQLRRKLSGDAWTEMGMPLLAMLGFLVVARLLGRSFWKGEMSRFSVRHWATGLVAIGALAMAMVIAGRLVVLAHSEAGPGPGSLRFLAPVEQPDAALEIHVANEPDHATFTGVVGACWPAVLAAVVWVYGAITSRRWFRAVRDPLAWTLLLWGALRLAQGAAWFFGWLLAFSLVQLAVPVIRAWWAVPAGSRAPAGASTATVVLLVLGAGLWAAGPVQGQAPVVVQTPPRVGVADRVVQKVRVEEDFAMGTVQVRWLATQGQWLPVLQDPGVLTRVKASEGTVRLVQVIEEGKRIQALMAEKGGLVEAEVEYQARVEARNDQRGFAVPVPHGLVNRLTVEIVGHDVDVKSSAAVSVQREAGAVGTNTTATLVLSPVNDVWVGWQPRSRDTRREKAVFYAEATQLYVPAAGVVEGWHRMQVRPAQGELSELTFDVPVGATVTDVTAPALSFWRFDPDTRRLRASLVPAQARPFSVQIKTQRATGPLPFKQSVGLVGVVGAAGQVGVVGVATGSEVQLEDADAGGLAAINLEDFPAAALEALKDQVSGLTVRRAFRYSDSLGEVRLSAAAVEPDVRVESQQTLSLGEDRVLLAATLDVEITRAGLFKLSFVLPTGMDVESISGAALSHWTELKGDTGRVVTLHLKAKTEGHSPFSVSLAGPGVKGTRDWYVPHLDLREAGKQRGQLLVVPEQGLRVQPTTRENVTQLDPVQAGVRQKGVLAFRLLQAGWRLALDLEPVDAWVEAASLQHVTVGEAQLKVMANLQYEIENTGVKGLRVRLPAAATGVRMRGEQVADFVIREEAGGGETRDWDVKLHRRVMGRYLLQVNYSVPVPENAATAMVLGIQALDVNVQRGFLTLQAGGRTQVRVENTPAALQPTDWQVIPRSLQQDIAAAAANYTFRLVDSQVQLPVRLVRHVAAPLLPARVQSVVLSSAIADDGVMLTQVRLQIVPGNKRMLQLRLPPEAQFWFAFVDQNSVWPWMEQDQVLIPLAQRSRTDEATTVEFLYACRAGKGGRRSLDLQLVGPKFDLPLENITWRVYLNEKWHLDDWKGSLRLQAAQLVSGSPGVGVETYILNESALRQEKTREAEQYLSLANSLLERGDPQQARRAFQAAYGLSQHDNAFNEDARVQLHNLKVQQAQVGLNVREARVAGEAGALAATPRGVREGQAPNYTQQEAKQLLARNPAEDNAVQTRLAERLIQQQDAAVVSPAAVRASIPTQGRQLTFTRPLETSRWADLRLTLEISARPAASWIFRTGLVLTVFVGLALLIGLGRRRAAA